MERESQYLLHLLGAYIKNETPQLCQEIDWYQLVKLANIHNLTGTLGYMVMTYPICPDQD